MKKYTFLINFFFLYSLSASDFKNPKFLNTETLRVSDKKHGHDIKNSLVEHRSNFHALEKKEILNVDENGNDIIENDKKNSLKLIDSIVANKENILSKKALIVGIKSKYTFHRPAPIITIKKA